MQYCIQDNNEIFRLRTSLSYAKKFRVKSINSRSEKRGLYDYKFLLYLSVIRTRMASSPQLRQRPSECNKERLLTDPVDAEGRNTETQCTHPFDLTTLVAAATDRRHLEGCSKKIILKIKKKEGKGVEIYRRRVN